MSETPRWTSIHTCPEYEGSTRERDYDHQLMVGGRCVAVVFWIGGHVERPDEWNVRVYGQDHVICAYSDLEDAKRSAERDWADIEAATETPEDRLWLEIMLRDDRTRGLDPWSARKALQDGGFPSRLIEKYLASR